MNVQSNVPAIIDVVEKRAAKFAEVLPPSIKVQRFVAASRTALLTVPGLLNCEPQSVLTALMRCATDGLVPDGRDAVLVVGKSKRGAAWVDVAQYWPMVGGLQKIVYRSGKVRRIEARVVYEGDTFSISYGTTPDVHHKPAFRDRGEIVAAYAIATLEKGDQLIEVMDREELDGIMKRSKSWDKIKGEARGPWATDYGEMCRKTLVRRIIKYLPTEAPVHGDDEDEAPTIEGELAEGAFRAPVQHGVFSTGKAAQLADAPVDEADPVEVAEAEMVVDVTVPERDAKTESVPDPSDVTLWKGRLRLLRDRLAEAGTAVVIESEWNDWNEKFNPDLEVTAAAKALIDRRLGELDYVAAKG